MLCAILSVFTFPLDSTSDLRRPFEFQQIAVSRLGMQSVAKIVLPVWRRSIRWPHDLYRRESHACSWPRCKASSLDSGPYLLEKIALSSLSPKPCKIRAERLKESRASFRRRLSHQQNRDRLKGFCLKRAGSARALNPTTPKALNHGFCFR